MPDLIPDSTIKASTGFKPIVQQWIYAVKNVKYNREQAPCVEDINYSFTSCIIDHIVKSTNCTVSQLQWISSRVYVNQIIFSVSKWFGEIWFV